MAFLALAKLKVSGIELTLGNIGEIAVTSFMSWWAKVSSM